MTELAGPSKLAASLYGLCVYVAPSIGRTTTKRDGSDKNRSFLSQFPKNDFGEVYSSAREEPTVSTTSRLPKFPTAYWRAVFVSTVNNMTVIV